MPIDSKRKELDTPSLHLTWHLCQGGIIMTIKEAVEKYGEYLVKKSVETGISIEELDRMEVENDAQAHLLGRY